MSRHSLQLLWDIYLLLILLPCRKHDNHFKAQARYHFFSQSLAKATVTMWVNKKHSSWYTKSSWPDSCLHARSQLPSASFLTKSPDPISCFPANWLKPVPVSSGSAAFLDRLSPLIFPWLSVLQVLRAAPHNVVHISYNTYFCLFTELGGHHHNLMLSQCHLNSDFKSNTISSFGNCHVVNHKAMGTLSPTTILLVTLT